MRIVSLCPSITELVFALDSGEELVGITTFCIHPAERVAAIEKVGGTKDPDVERIAALAPDVVLLNEEENRREDAEALAAAGVPCLTTFPRTVAETADSIREIATALSKPSKGESLAAAIEARAAEVRRAAAQRPPVRFAYLIWRKPWMAAGGGTYVDDLLATAGGQNVFGGAQERYPTVDPASFADHSVDRILLSSEPFPFESKHIDELVTLTGLSPDSFLLVDGESLSWHGPRTLEGLDTAEESLVAALS